MSSTTPADMYPARASQQKILWPDLGLNTLETAIVHTVAYADLFDYPLTPEETHHYLVRVPASPAAVHDALQASQPLSRYIACSQGYVTLRGRETIVNTRRRRASVASSLWPRVERYASSMAYLPFVRMVGVSGSVSVGNTDGKTDIDYFIVTEPGRLWLCRALIIGLVRLAARSGDSLCPNYLVSERALALPNHNLFTAHEFLQMVPLLGPNIYQLMCQANAWAAEFLPNAYESARGVTARPLPRHRVRGLAEAALSTPLGDRLEQWEMKRKIARFARTADGGSATFGADCCKGHFMDHGQHILSLFAMRLQELAQP